MSAREKWWREFDLSYWQMRSALGYSIPGRIEERWPHQMNAGNPYQCGFCASRRNYPWLDCTHEKADEAFAAGVAAGYIDPAYAAASSPRPPIGEQ